MLQCINRARILFVCIVNAEKRYVLHSIESYISIRIYDVFVHVQHSTNGTLLVIVVGELIRQRKPEQASL